MTSFLFIVITPYEEEGHVTESGVQTDGNDNNEREEEVEKDEGDDNDDKKSNKNNEEGGVENNTNDDHSTKTGKPGPEKKDGAPEGKEALVPNHITPANKRAEKKTPEIRTECEPATIDVVEIKLNSGAKATVLANGPKNGPVVALANIHLRESSDKAQKQNSTIVDPVSVKIQGSVQGTVNSLKSDTSLDGYINSDNDSEADANTELPKRTQKKSRFKVTASNPNVVADGYASSDNETSGDLNTKKNSPNVETKKKGRFNISKISDNEESGGNETDKDNKDTRSTKNEVVCNSVPNSIKAIEHKEDEEAENKDEKSGVNKEEKDEEEEKDENLEDEVLTPLVVVDLPLFKKVQDTLEAMGVFNIDMEMIGQRRFFKFSFILDDSQTCEKVLNRLKGLGVGSERDSSVSVFPSTLYHGYKAVDNADSLYCNDDSSPEKKQESRARDVFVKSIKSRLVVQQVVNTVTADALFTFDYLLLLILAGFIACVGLVENSSVALVASMLISPLMGPILAATFGQVIKNYELRNLGITSELKGLLICLVTGFLFGLVTGGIGLKGASWGSSTEWPTSEMVSRGMLRALWVGVLIAVPSGAGVALSVLGGNAGSLVGVAISASLLPPACNAGMLWAYAVLSAISPPEVISALNTASTTVLPDINSTSATNISMTTTDPPPPPSAALGTCPALVNNEYVPTYSCNLASDAAILGIISLGLTIVNIICIMIMGVLVLKIKEVAPETAGPSKSFFTEDIEVARNYNVVQKGKTATTLGKQLLEEYKKFKDNQGKLKEGEEKSSEETSDSGSESDESLDEDVAVLTLVNTLKNVQQAPDVRAVLSKLPTFPAEDITDELHTDYYKAVNKVNDHFARHPSHYFSEHNKKERRLLEVYNTIHHVNTPKPIGRVDGLATLFEPPLVVQSPVRRKFRKNNSDLQMRPTSMQVLEPKEKELFRKRRGTQDEGRGVRFQDEEQQKLL